MLTSLPIVTANAPHPVGRAAPATLALVALLAAGCGVGGDDSAGAVDGSVSGEVVVFAAASLTEAFTEIGESFEAAHPDASVRFSFAASSELVAQILEGAPADVYASADLATMSRLTDAGLSAVEPVVFAENRSEIVVAEGNPLGIGTVADLADPDLLIVTCAPQAPCGAYATQIFERAGVEVTPDSYEQNVKSVVTKVRIGEADAGIAYATDVAAAADDVDGVAIPAEVDVVAEYPMTLTTEATNPVGGDAFVDLVVSGSGRAILAAHGFSTP
jgi:molybdate transport system substrate-binding protein